MLLTHSLKALVHIHKTSGDKLATKEIAMTLAAAHSFSLFRWYISTSIYKVSTLKGVFLII